MHVFIDTNILLNFFHFTKDEVDALNDVFATHQHGSATVHLTEQVRDEFLRNRENKIKDAIKKFKEVRFTAQLPSFMKSYDEYETIRKLSVELQRHAKSIMEKAEVDIAARNLLADHLIKDIFEKSQPVETTAAFFSAASMRMAIGNPPGKNSSIGDAINWTVLLSSVPNGENLHVISEDGDFYSNLDENKAHPFLEDEWCKKKNSKLFVYRTLSSFLSKHFDGVAFSFDKAKDALIDDLAAAGGFSTTHHLISKLEDYSYFSLREVQRILAAAVSNNQFGWIVTDNDVSDFLNRIAVPRQGSITNSDQQAVIAKVIEEQITRAQLNA